MLTDERWRIGQRHLASTSKGRRAPWLSPFARLTISAQGTPYALFNIAPNLGPQLVRYSSTRTSAVRKLPLMLFLSSSGAPRIGFPRRPLWIPTIVLGPVRFFRHTPDPDHFHLARNLRALSLEAQGAKTPCRDERFAVLGEAGARRLESPGNLWQGFGTAASYVGHRAYCATCIVELFLCWDRGVNELTLDRAGFIFLASTGSFIYSLSSTPRYFRTFTA